MGLDMAYTEQLDQRAIRHWNRSENEGFRRANEKKTCCRKTTDGQQDWMRVKKYILSYDNKARKHAFSRHSPEVPLSASAREVGANGQNGGGLHPQREAFSTVKHRYD
eukprot:CAMPEP_0184750454 /NCGR_PEP_ID=MMETSP0315-20130426/36533_1 /TAXON_ID=101924 /ORGANISM="Rhodosorus marinus, Strain UTEX LB 2760" /LENGTH=107 /DNA_ID=CAMNT_0027228689 /DNA_START=91 /DNA_END=411 /DNA_ORIENTATION=-